LNRNVLLALAISVLSCGAVRAQDDGEPPPPPVAANLSDEPVFMAGQLKADCQPPAAADAAAKAAAGKVCDSYLRGMADGLFMVGAMGNSKIPVCLPSDGPLAVEDVKTAFLKYVTDHPEALDHSAGLASAFAVVAANPCADENMEAGDGEEE
jgi:Rap1a immunity proteins